MEGAKELSFCMTSDGIWHPGIHREWTGRRETSTAGEGSPFAAIWSQDMDIMGFVGYVFVGCNAVIVSGFVVVLQQEHSKTLCFSCITESLTRNFMTSFFSPKGTLVENSAPPHVLLWNWDSAGWSPSYRIGSRAQTSTTLPGVRESRVFFQISRVFLKFLVGFKRKDFMQVWCKYDASMMGFDSCFHSDISNM